MKRTIKAKPGESTGDAVKRAATETPEPTLMKHYFTKHSPGWEVVVRATQHVERYGPDGKLIREEKVPPLWVKFRAFRFATADPDLQQAIEKSVYFGKQIFPVKSLADDKAIPEHKGTEYTSGPSTSQERSISESGDG